MTPTKKRALPDGELERLLGREMLLSVDQAAVYLAVSASTLNHWRSGGRGPRFVKLCGSSRGAIRYRVADLREYVEKNTFASVAEAELANAMSRVGAAWDVWGLAHPFIAHGAHFLVDSALADRDTMVRVFFDPLARIRWLKPEQALCRPWIRAERRLVLLQQYINSSAGHGRAAEVAAAYQAALAKVPEQQWCGHPDLTIETLLDTVGGRHYPLEFSR